MRHTIALLLCALLAACSKRQDDVPADDATNSVPVSKDVNQSVVERPKSSIRTPEPLPKATSTTVERIGADYKSNEVKADATWKDKRVVVKVKIVAIIKSKNGKPMVAVLSGFRPGVNTDMAFVFPVDSQDVLPLKMGDTVKIEATVIGVKHLGGESYVILEDSKVSP